MKRLLLALLCGFMSVIGLGLLFIFMYLVLNMFGNSIIWGIIAFLFCSVIWWVVLDK